MSAEKGFQRRPAGRLAAPLAAALLLGAAALRSPPAASPGQGPGPRWWEIRLTVSAKGEFAVRGGGEPAVSGEYALRARVEGRLDPDGGDFLLIHGGTETLEWDLRRTDARDGAGPAAGSPKVPAPVLRLNYVLRGEDHVEVDFAFDGGRVPLRSPPAGIALELPVSDKSGGEKNRPGYLDDVLSGSNRIVLPSADLARRRSERAFAWSWSGSKRVEMGARVYVTAQSHSAEAVVALVRH